MAILRVNDADLYYIKKGNGEETVVFSHGFLFSHKMFQPQIDELSEEYTVIAYDHRGQGQSEVTSSGYDINSYTDDAYKLITKLVDGPVHFAGLSTGGFVGLRLSLNYPKLIESLTLINTTAEAASSFKKFKFRVLRGFERFFGISPIIGQVISSLFGKQFLNNPENQETIQYWKDEIISNDKMGMYRSFDAAIFRDDITDKLSQIISPVLIIGGKDDTALSPEESEVMNEFLPNSTLVLLENVGHSSTIEAPKQVTKAIQKFLHSN